MTVVVAFAIFNITINITENANRNINLNNINECAFAAKENTVSNATSMTFGCTQCSNMNVPGCKHLPEDSSSTCSVGKCSECGAAGAYLS